MLRTTMIYTDLELTQMQLNALFVHDARGKLLRINEPEPVHPAPRFYLVRTRSGQRWRTRYDLPPDLAAELDHLAAQEPVRDELAEVPHYAADYALLLNEHDPIVTTEAG